MLTSDGNWREVSASQELNYIGEVRRDEVNISWRCALVFSEDVVPHCDLQDKACSGRTG